MSPHLPSELTHLLAAMRRLPQLTRFARQLIAELDASLPTDAPGRALALHRLCQKMVAAHRLELRLVGSVPRKPCILVANHLGYLDPLILCSSLRCAPIAKHEVRHWPLIGTFAQRYGAIFVRRSDPHSGATALRHALGLLQAGVSVLNFPEGTTTTGRLRDFQRGIFGLARLAGVPVVPLTVWFSDRRLCWVDEAWLLPHYLKLLGSDSLAITVEVGAPLGSEGQSAAELAQTARGSIQRRLHAVWPDTAL